LKESIVKENGIFATTERMSAQIGDTPLSTTYFRINGAWRPVRLKLEGYNPAGSLKDRTAAYLIRDLENRGVLRSSSIIVESTSGNLGVGLAFLCRERGYRFLAVIDPKSTLENRRKMQNFGAELELVDEQDGSEGYLPFRLRRVQELCRSSPRYVWTDQYSNPANPRAHYLSTGPEIYRQIGGRLDGIFIAVSTGGTLAGIGRYLREVSPRTKIIAVDAYGSTIFGGPSRLRKLNGIGSARQSSFISPELYDTHILVTDRDAFALCRQVDAATGIKVGGSSGAVLYACAQYLSRHPEMTNVVCLCPDGGENYASTIFHDGWMRKNGFPPEDRVQIVDDIAPATAVAAQCK
jgi:2,3-diaminopropionate biosynthesis protein SbnA